MSKAFILGMLALCSPIAATSITVTNTTSADFNVLFSRCRQGSYSPAISVINSHSYVQFNLSANADCMLNTRTERDRKSVV